jgi:hypothetical protein
VDAAGQPHLDEESDGRHAHANPPEERGNRVGGFRAEVRLGRHVQLLIDNRRTNGREADDERDDLQLR